MRVGENSSQPANVRSALQQAATLLPGKALPFPAVYFQGKEIRPMM